MKPAINSLTFVSAKRLPLTLAAACLGVGAIGLAVTLHEPVDLSPFSPTAAPRIVAQTNSAPVVTPEPFDFALEEPVVAVAATPEATAEAVFVVAAARPFVPVVRPAAPVATAAPEPTPEPGVSAAGSFGPEAIGDVEVDVFEPVPSKDTAGAPPEPYFLPNQGLGKDSTSESAAAPVPAGVVAGMLPEYPEDMPNPDHPLPVVPKDKRGK